MDKRNFIKTLGALSFSPIISASEFSKSHSLSNNLPKIDNDDELSFEIAGDLSSFQDMLTPNPMDEIE